MTWTTEQHDRVARRRLKCTQKQLYSKPKERREGGVASTPFFPPLNSLSKKSQHCDLKGAHQNTQGKKTAIYMKNIQVHFFY
jgi:hypothetical protein